MTGEVSPSGEGLLRLRVHGPDNRLALVSVGVDTGFTDALCLHRDTISALQLPYLHRTVVELGNGGLARMEVYAGHVEWHGRLRRVKVHATDGDALLGLALLRGSRLCMDIVDGGAVSIEPFA